MKTTNRTRIIGRILLQALLPVILMELCIFVMIRTTCPESNQEQYINMMLEDHILKAGALIYIIILLFACWFHFISQHRFMNRKPKGLYKEYITWFLREE